MDQQTLITLIGLAVTVVALCVALASFLYLFARNIKKYTEAQNTATREQLGEQIARLRADHVRAEEKLDVMAKAQDVREGFALLRGSLDTLERRTFDIATGSAGT